MDPHSRISQFNHRVKKAGPASRSIDHQKPTQPVSAKKTADAANPAATLLIKRPIATNSRIKQDEIVKRDMYLSFVTNALEQKALGKADPFDQLVAQFSPAKDSQINTTELRLWINSLSHVVSRLEKIHSSLVHAIVNLPWVALDNATVKSYTMFVGSLVSARPEYLSLILAKIAQGFTYHSAFHATASNIASTSTSAPITRRVVYDRQHYLLRHLLSLIPTLPSTLQPLLIRNFPHKRQNQAAQTTYIRNVLRIGAYCPELQDKILATIVDRAIQIDVEVQIELEELEELDDENGADQEVFELDPFDVVLGQEDPSLSDESDDEDETFSDLSSDAGDSDDEKQDVTVNVKHIQDMVRKLDAILLLVFEHLQETYTAATNPASTQLPSDSLDFPLPASDTTLPLSPLNGSSRTRTAPKATAWDPKLTLRAQFDSLLSIFDRTILRTFKSRYTQFLLFWYASLDPEYSDVFQGMLVDRALLGVGTQQSHGVHHSRAPSDGPTTMSQAHTSIPELTRAAAASYIGSFVSRATFVDRDGTRRVVNVLCEYLKAHLEGVEEALKEDWSGSYSSSSSNIAAVLLAPGQHTVFYAVAQAVFLIFCFRWRDLLLDDADLDEAELMFTSSPVRPSISSSGIMLAKDKWIPELAILKRIVSCVLNPLKVCSSNVVMQFARVAQATEFMYCYPILDANKRAEGPGNGANGGQGLGSASGSAPPMTAMSTMFNPTLLGGKLVNSELNTFFPFDPYRLPKSNAFIQGVYREWSSVALDQDDDSDEDDEDDSDGDGDEDEAGVEDGSDEDRLAGSRCLPVPARRRGAGDDELDAGLGQSLEAMSISPQRMAMSISMSVSMRG